MTEADSPGEPPHPALPSTKPVNSVIAAVVTANDLDARRKIVLEAEREQIAKRPKKRSGGRRWGL